MEHNDFPWRGNTLIKAIARFSAYVWRWNGDSVGLRPFLGRYTAHIALLLICMLLVSLGTWRGSVVRAFSQNVALGQSNLSAVEAVSNVVAHPYYRVSSQARVPRRAEPKTAIPERPRLEIITHVVQVGETAETIAEIYGLQPTTIMWANPELEKSPDLLRIGQVLTILPLDGVYHTVENGDTLESLAETYEVSVESIVECSFNTVRNDGALMVGSKLVVPGGSKPYVQRDVTTYAGPVPEDVTGSGLFRWPAPGFLSQGYWYGHRAIDIADSVGAAIVASDDGYVSFAGWTDVGYGYLIVLDHSNGYKTFYAHLSNIFVFEGQTVTAGEVIGAMGSTGNSTGPHLHFELRYNGYPTNPLIYLP
ncbi:MAG: peptidoglycan DD-metalloendopeptidase family protein [Anaerolineae bacterium]|nr:peptidoglycan DD-metalloendopeptidase family protein [Anaerolineae bacterium]